MSSTVYVIYGSDFKILLYPYLYEMTKGNLY